jgi:hypothetical protein
MRPGTRHARRLWLNDAPSAWDAALATYDHCVAAKSDLKVAANAKKKAKTAKKGASAPSLSASEAKTLVELDMWWRTELPPLLAERAGAAAALKQEGEKKKKTAPKPATKGKALAGAYVTRAELLDILEWKMTRYE